MITFKCKMCGGDLHPEENATTCECEYCGSIQTIPTADSEKKMNLIGRAQRLLRTCEFDKAAGVYESVVAEFPEEAEAYWGLVLCKYGIEYVDDPSTGKKVPTCHRSSFDSVMDDSNFEQAAENADAIARRIYREEAKQIEELRKGIIEVSGKEQPYDIFICYKETDENGERTLDSVIAQDIYNELTEKGYRVFFSRITLEDKLGQEYEPYIFSALNSAKIMLAVGTDYEYYNAVWVKNEWSRFLKLIASGEKKTLIPCYKGIDAYDMPKEFARLQAQDMGKVGAMQDLMRGVGKILPKDEPAKPAQQTLVRETGSVGNTGNIGALLKRAFMFLEDGDFAKADEFCEQVLNMDPENSRAYLGKLMVQLKVRKEGDLRNQAQPFDGNGYYQKIVRFGDESLKSQMKEDINFIKNRNEHDRQKGIYDQASDSLSKATTIKQCNMVKKLFESVPDYEGATEKIAECDEKRKTILYDNAMAKMRSARSEDDYAEASKQFRSISGYMDSDDKADECNRMIDIRKKAASKAAEIQDRFSAMIAANKSAEKSLRDTRANCDEKKRELDRIQNDLKIMNQRKVSWSADLSKCEMELRNQKGLFTGKRRRELEVIIGNEHSRMSRLNSDIAEAEKKLTVARRSYDQVQTRLNELMEDTPETIDKREIKYQIGKCYYDYGLYGEAYHQFKPISGYKDVDSIIENDNNISAAAAVAAWRAQFKVGKTVTFGSYDQDNNTLNGAEAIEWLVLAKHGETATLISKYGLDAKPYNKEHTDVTWETCTLRKWLNSDFLNAAFTPEEQDRLQTVTVTVDKNPEFSTNPGNDTQDKVYLLSIDEVNRYFASDTKRVCMPTKTAVANGAFTGDSRACTWWLRSPGRTTRLAAYVYGIGSIYNFGLNICCDSVAVRPVVVLRLI